MLRVVPEVVFAVLAALVAAVVLAASVAAVVLVVAPIVTGFVVVGVGSWWSWSSPSSCSSWSWWFSWCSWPLWYVCMAHGRLTFKTGVILDSFLRNPLFQSGPSLISRTIDSTT